MAKRKTTRKSGDRGKRKRTEERRRTGRQSKKKLARAGRKRGSSPDGVPRKVRVRMYRHGLGDCFLLTFDVGRDERHMLIDCGTLGSTTTGVKVAEVVKDIRQTTGDHLHLVAATHEHLDHVSGFASQDDAFKKFKVDHVWLAWTEDPEDRLAQKVAKYKGDLGQALAVVAQAFPDTAVATHVHGLLDFYGDDHLLGAGKFRERLNTTMEFVRTGLGVKARCYKPDNAPIEVDWLPGFRFYVLGPPHSAEPLRNMGEHGSAELYGMVAGIRAAAQGAIHAATSAATARDDDTAPQQPVACEEEMPVDKRFRKQEGKAKQWAASYFEASEHWRTIDHDWLRSASDLALQLDSITNNTSLALAVERISDGKVLLFPGDAQQGNWLSWHDPQRKWSVRDGDGATHEVTAAQLLGRTVFYKVGHHASHNATAKEHGLELMTQRDELTAFIPVDRSVALSKSPQGSWRMPARTLYRRLLEKCQGRVVRSDLGWARDAREAKDRKTEREFLNLATKDEWGRWLKAQNAAEKTGHVNTKQRLYIDYVLG